MSCPCKTKFQVCVGSFAAGLPLVDEFGNLAVHETHEVNKFSQVKVEFLGIGGALGEDFAEDGLDFEHAFELDRKMVRPYMECTSEVAFTVAGAGDVFNGLAHQQEVEGIADRAFAESEFGLDFLEGMFGFIGHKQQSEIACHGWGQTFPFVRDADSFDELLLFFF